jgi:hypothetical protein
MATSGTVAFNPSTGSLVVSAFGRLGLRPSELTSQHFFDAANEANFVNVDMCNRLPLLWQSELYEVELEEGVATYTLPARLINYMAVYITVDDGGDAYDRILAPLSTFEYAALPNKTTEGPPTSFWFNRLETPQISFWPVPDEDDVYTLKIQAMMQIEDASLPAGTTINMPYRFLDVFVAKLAHRLARIYRPERETLLKADAEEAWQVAATEDVEQVPLFVLPGLGSYYW